ncbi:MAG: NADPH-dependent reductase [Conexibacter sp.]|nr:NADPH-dependent reductase [Conexibacter sp.]
MTIVGATGDLGFGLALRLAKAGTPVVIGSRDGDRAEQAAEQAAARVPGAEIRGLENPEAAAQSEIVVVSVPFPSQAPTLKSLRGVLREGQIVVDVTAPLASTVGGRATRVLQVWQGSAAQQAQELVPRGVTVVSALHTVSAAHLADLDYVFDEDVLVTGDDRDARRRVAELVERVEGLRAVDCGKLEVARLTEQLTALTIAINIRHRATAGIKITGLPDELWS